MEILVFLAVIGSVAIFSAGFVAGVRFCERCQQQHRH